MPEFEGVPITIAGKEWIVPALNFAAIRRLRTQIEAIASIPLGAGLTDEQIDTVILIIHTALVRNYPGLTKDNVEDMMTLANIKPIINAIMGISGFVSSGGAGADGLIGT
jgi:hypothetical protein